MTIKEAINEGVKILDSAGIKDSFIKVKIILAYAIKKSKEYLIINQDENISSAEKNVFFKSLEKLSQNIPLQYIVNKQEFMGLDFYVDESVLIPRFDTEILVEEVLRESLLEEKDVLDLCTGSGVIAISLAKLGKCKRVVAIDKSKEALEVARKNAILQGVNEKIEFIESDMFEKLDFYKKFDVIVSNPPYIESDIIKNLDKEVQKEPQIALDGGIDGMKFYRIIAENSLNFLKDDGKVFLEIGYNQKEIVMKIFNKYFKNVTCIKDLAGLDRVIVVKRYIKIIN